MDTGFDTLKDEQQNFRVGKNLQGSDKMSKIDESKIVDLDEEGDKEFMDLLGNE